MRARSYTPAVKPALAPYVPLVYSRVILRIISSNIEIYDSQITHTLILCLNQARHRVLIEEHSTHFGAYTPRQIGRINRSIPLHLHRCLTDNSVRVQVTASSIRCIVLLYWKHGLTSQNLSAIHIQQNFGRLIVRSFTIQISLPFYLFFLFYS